MTSQQMGPEEPDEDYTGWEEFGPDEFPEPEQVDPESQS